MRNGDLRFGVYVLQDAPLPVLRGRWREAEELGFDDIWLADHARDLRRPSGHWFDAWATLAVMATETARARIGTLVSNPVLRPPAMLARLATTVDHLSGGRLELGIGTGIAGFDRDATGTPYWPISSASPASRSTSRSSTTSSATPPNRSATKAGSTGPRDWDSNLPPCNDHGPR